MLDQGHRVAETHKPAPWGGENKKGSETMKQQVNTQFVHASCGHTYVAPIEADGAHLAGLPCTRCVGRDFPADLYRIPGMKSSSTCRHCGKPIIRQHIGAYDGDHVQTILGNYSGINTPIYGEDYSGHPDYHPACWIEYVTQRQARWTESKRQADADRAEFHAASNAAFQIAVAFESRLADVPGRVDEFVGAGGRGYRFTPQGELPVVEVRAGVATYPDTARNRQLKQQGIITY